MAEGRKKKLKCPAASPFWMLTYGDMTTLLLTFFIMMFTVAEVDGQELRLILSSFTGSFGVQPGGKTLEKGPLADMGKIVETLPSSQPGTKMAKALKKAMSLVPIRTNLPVKNIKETERGIVISLTGDIYFNKGSAEIAPEAYPILKRICDLIKTLKTEYGMDNPVAVEGHSDDTKPIGDLQHDVRTNWELSSMRAINIVKYFIHNCGIDPYIQVNDQLVDSKFRAVSFAHYRPYNMRRSSNDMESGKANNRRVDIIILRD